MVHIECGKCGYSCGTEKAWKRHEQPGCWKLPLEATMTPEEKLAQRFGLQWSDMKDLKSTFEAFGMMSESGGIEHVDELAELRCVLYLHSVQHHFCQHLRRGAAV